MKNFIVVCLLVLFMGYSLPAFALSEENSERYSCTSVTGQRRAAFSSEYTGNARIFHSMWENTCLCSSKK